MVLFEMNNLFIFIVKFQIKPQAQSILSLSKKSSHPIDSFTILYILCKSLNIIMKPIFSPYCQPYCFFFFFVQVSRKHLLNNAFFAQNDTVKPKSREYILLGYRLSQLPVKIHIECVVKSKDKMHFFCNPKKYALYLLGLNCIL